MQLTEEKLRAFNKCTEFHNRGGLVSLPTRTLVTEFVYSNIVLDMMRAPETFEFKFSLTAHLQRAVKALKLKEQHTNAEIEECRRAAAIAVDEIVNILVPRLYMPVFGTFSYPVKISESVLNLRLSSILTTTNHTVKARTLHAVTFSPYTSPADMQNDLVQTIKSTTLAMANPIKHAIASNDITLHVFSLGTTKHLHYVPIECSPTAAQSWASYIEQPIKLLESGYHYPVVPCNFSCQFKSTCNVRRQLDTSLRL